jgi:hypothetical protein
MCVTSQRVLTATPGITAPAFPIDADALRTMSSNGLQQLNLQGMAQAGKLMLVSCQPINQPLCMHMCKSMCVKDGHRGPCCHQASCTRHMRHGLTHPSPPYDTPSVLNPHLRWKPRQQGALQCSSPPPRPAASAVLLHPPPAQYQHQ